MKSTTIKILSYLLAFFAMVGFVFITLEYIVNDISGPAPDALHFIGFVALVPMIGSVGGKLSARKIAYIKNDTLFNPMIVATFITTYISLIPWVLTFFIAENSFLIYIDWSIVLASIALSFILFAGLLTVFLKK